MIARNAIGPSARGSGPARPRFDFRPVRLRPATSSSFLGPLVGHPPRGRLPGYVPAGTHNIRTTTDGVQVGGNRLLAPNLLWTRSPLGLEDAA